MVCAELFLTPSSLKMVDQEFPSRRICRTLARFGVCQLVPGS
jgi:hypothetical protein